MLSTENFIAEVKAHPVLYKKVEGTIELKNRRQAWFKVAEAMSSDWAGITKSEMYERVLELQKKWKHLRDGFNREVRVRSKANNEGTRSRQTYIYYKQLKFLKGDEDEASSSEDDPLIFGKRKKTLTFLKGTRVSKRASIKDEVASPDNEDQEEEVSELEVEASDFNNVDFSEEMQVEDQSESDSDRMFLLSFLPEMQRLPAHVRMWTRAQISKVMQDAVAYCCRGQHAQLPACSSGARLDPDAVPDRHSLRNLTAQLQRDTLESD